jgi:DNA-binding FadR family transcriptional regulator
MSGKRTRERAAVRIARKIVSEIRRLRLRPGTQLDSEHRMVEEFGVSRATVREALRFLELQGALRIKAGPGGGPVVSVPGADHLASVLSLHLQFADASFSSVVDARRSIYPVLAGQAAENATRENVATLRESISRMNAGVHDPDHFREEARRFMSLLAAASGNRVLALAGTRSSGARRSVATRGSFARSRTEMRTKPGRSWTGRWPPAHANGSGWLPTS